jgi:hypothetical protein
MERGLVAILLRFTNGRIESSGCPAGMLTGAEVKRAPVEEE